MSRRLVDLSMPVADHFRWPVERSVKGDFSKGDVFQVTRLGWAVHGFTHMDSPRHMFPDGITTTDVPLDSTIGSAAVIDLTDVKPDEAIDAARLAARADHLAPGDITLFKTAWSEQRDMQSETFWREAPYLTADAASWLLDRQPKAVGFDFPQDYTIRLLLDGERRPIEEQVTHHILLRNGVILIEYLTNTRALEAARVDFMALPLKILECDGAPVRAVAWVEDEVMH